MLENFTDLLAIVSTVFGIIMSSANFPQTFKMSKRKSSADISLATYLMLLPGTIAWMLYGLSINNLPIILTNIVGTIGVISVIAAYFVYKK
jgi:MtN3 and saliva related transmembrane protein